MAPMKRQDAKHNKPKFQMVQQCPKPNPLKHVPIVKKFQGPPGKTCQNRLEDELVMHLTEIKNAYSKKHLASKMNPQEYMRHNQKPPPEDLYKSNKVFNVVSAALECGCVHDLLQRQGNYYCLRNRCVQHTNPGATRYCQNCCKMHRMVKGPQDNDFLGARPYGQPGFGVGGPKMQVLHCPECRALERARK